MSFNVKKEDINEDQKTNCIECRYLRSRFTEQYPSQKPSIALCDLHEELSERYTCPSCHQSLMEPVAISSTCKNESAHTQYDIYSQPVPRYHK